MNFLPIPALDGGRLFLLLFEMLTGKKVNPKFEESLHKIGFVLLMALMVFVVIKGYCSTSAITILERLDNMSTKIIKVGNVLIGGGHSISIPIYDYN